MGALARVEFGRWLGLHGRVLWWDGTRLCENVNCILVDNVIVRC